LSIPFAPAKGKPSADLKSAEGKAPSSNSVA
jgi:hypothetical protein